MLTFTLRAEVPGPLEVEGFTPSACREATRAEIERRPIWYGNRMLPLAEFFTVTGNPSSGDQTWQGDLTGVHHLAAGLDDGTVRVEGSVGRHLGGRMTGGTIVVTGDVGDWAGAEMTGGRIDVAGRAGDHLGGAYPGNPTGMRGGTILVTGDAGHRVGHRQRRGLIAIGGRAGDFLGYDMRAGTILALAGVGQYVGTNMRRGTIILQTPNRPFLTCGFVPGGTVRLVAMRLIARHLQTLGYPPSVKSLEGDLALWHGDLLDGGRGEILVAMP